MKRLKSKNLKEIFVVEMLDGKQKKIVLVRRYHWCSNAGAFQNYFVFYFKKWFCLNRPYQEFSQVMEELKMEYKYIKGVESDFIILDTDVK